MNTTPLTRLIGLVLLVQFSPCAIAQTPAGPADTKAVYATLEPTVFEISNLADEEPVRVGVRLQPNIKAVEPLLADVALGERHDQSLIAFFSVAMEKVEPGAKVVPALLIHVKRKFLQTGSYKLRIELRPAAASPQPTPSGDAKKTVPNKSPTETAGGKPQSVTVELKLPAAEIKALEKLVIHQVRNSFWDDDPATLTITEISGKGVRLTDVKIYQTYPTAVENQANSQTVSFQSVPEILPNATGKSAITLSGNFPLGSSVGAALISAPQLPKPVWMGFAVKSARSQC